MTQEKVDMFITSKSNYLPQESLPLLKEKLLELDESKFVLLQSVDFKDPTIMLIVSLLAGNLGIDRFMLEDIGMGVLKLLTGGVFGMANASLYNKPSILIGRKGTINKPFWVDKPFWCVDTMFYSVIDDTKVLPKYLFYNLSNIGRLRHYCR